ncbi:MAG: RdgB/HAM1 family non-canonical purine NTP pyrophosphatase [Alphaproteobacteria bacterium]
MRAFDGDKLVIATHNQGKLREFADLLAPYAKTIVSAGDLNLIEPEETGSTFIENAKLKSQAAAQASQAMALADDSGLCVVALNDQPGLYSARWGGPQKDFHMAMQRVQDELGNAANRSAYFICVLSLTWPDGHTEVFEGRIDGTITWPPRGDKGHGYDPIFIPRGHTRTFGEMESAEKNALSHRGRAVDKLIKRLQQT